MIGDSVAFSESLNAALCDLGPRHYDAVPLHVSLPDTSRVLVQTAR